MARLPGGRGGGTDDRDVSDIRERQRQQAQSDNESDDDQDGTDDGGGGGGTVTTNAGFDVRVGGQDSSDDSSGGGGGGSPDSGLEDEQQAARTAARAVTEADPGFSEERQQERDEAVQAARTAARAVREDPGRQAALDDARDRAQQAAVTTARAVRGDPGRPDRRRRQPATSREEQAGDIRVGIPGTDRTVEGATQDLADRFERGVTDPAGEAAGTAVDVLADPGSVNVVADEDTGEVFVRDSTAGEVAETTTRSLVGLANIPATARGLDELAVEPAAEVAAGGPPTEAPERARTLAEYGGRRAAAGLDAYFEVSEERLEQLESGDIGSVEDEPLVAVESDREAEVGGLLAGGLASAAVTGGAFAASQGTRAGRVTRWAVQPGEEAAIAAANRGLASPRVASLVPGVRRDQFDFGSAEERLATDRFEVREPLESEQLRTGGGVELEPVGRERSRPRPGESPDRGRPVVDEPTIDIRAGRPTVSREAAVESDIRTEATLEPDIDTAIRRFEGNARRSLEEPAADTIARLETATEPLQGVGVRGGLETRLDTRLDSRLEGRLEGRLENRLEARGETRGEVRTDLRSELRSEGRQEQRLETRLEARTETGTEVTLPELDADLLDEDADTYDVLEASRERRTGLATGADLLESFEQL